MKITKPHTLWTEEFRPTTLDNYICSEEFKEKIEGWIKENDIPHLLLVATPGTGKTTLSKLLINTLDCDSLFINASDESGIETIREKVKQFASSAGFRPIKIIVLEEAGRISKDAQAALLNIIEEYSRNTRFILTTNYINKIIEPLQSRLELHKVLPPGKIEVYKHVTKNILDYKKITWDKHQVAELIKEYYPDIRSIIKNLQRWTKNKHFTFTKNELLQEPFHQILEILKNPSKTSWKDIKQIVENEIDWDNNEELFIFLYNKLSEFAPGKEPECLLIIAEGQWRGSVVSNKIINLMSMFSNILITIK